MSNEFHKAAILSCKVILKPVVKYLLHYGLSFKEFSEISKFAYLDAAIGSDQENPNISEAAVKTGISRKLIKRLLSRKQKDEIVFKGDGLYDLRLLECWREEAGYQDENGEPLPLPFSCDVGPCLLSLIAKIGADVPPSALVKRMLSTDLVDIDSVGNYVPRVNNPTPSFASPDSLVRASFFIAAHIDTVSSNHTDSDTVKKLERQTFSVRVPSERREELLIELRAVCNGALRDIEQIIAKKEVPSSVKSCEVIGVGMYTFDYNLPTDELCGVFDGTSN